MHEIKKKIKELLEELDRLKNVLKIEGKKKQIEELQQEMGKQNFWDDQKTASKVVKQLKEVKTDVDGWSQLYHKVVEVKELLEIAQEDYLNEIKEELAKLDQQVEKVKLQTLFSEKFDQNNAIVEINSGAGGTEACDWAQMLFRMYSRWVEENKFTTRVLTEVRGEEAGIKNVTFFVEGVRAYGLLKSERGVHRLVRISPFDANKRRHTSFASVDILPHVAEDIEIEIKPEEIKVDTFRASGAGGQHVNVTDSAVRITHIPTGIIVGCQNERSQHQNKQVALNVLKAKLYELKEEEKSKELEKLSGTKRKIEWGSQIRSYVLHPYLLVKDHRTDFENHNAWAVLDGKLDEFMYAYLKFLKQ